ncbi:PIN domain-containing protein [Candidatus Woesearchaeota archaeon]|nr:PIN domain-containing protein [Candidatus Woesearchaeota archaeon]
MASKIFIDTNIIVHYIILKKIKETERDNKELWKEYRRIEPSYQLLSLILKNNNDSFEFYTSHLAITEIANALHDEYRCRRMRRDGIPLSSWVRLKHRFNLEKEDADEILSEIVKFIESFRIKIILLEEKYTFSLIYKFILEKQIGTQDSILLSTAINSKCSHFATQDKELRKKKLKEIKVVSADEIRDEIVK